MNEVELLDAAALRLSCMAMVATPGPWRNSGCEIYASDNEDPVVEVGFEAGGFTHETDAAWSALVDPAVAEPLAQILRGASFNLSCHPEYRTWMTSYIDLARVIMRSSVEAEAVAAGSERSDPEGEQ